MKKFLLSVVVAMLTTMGLMAGHWTGPTTGTYAYNTTVVVTPQLNGTAMTSSQTVEIAAFIGNECRGVGSTIEANGKLSFQVYYNASESAADVNFKAYYNGVEYIMKEKATLNGINQLPVTFNIQVPTKIELSDFRLNLDIDANKSADLYDYLKFYIGTTAKEFSALASYPPVTFATTDTEHITLSSSTVTAKKSTNARGVKVTAASGTLTADGYVQVAPIDYEVVAIRFGYVDTSEGTVALNPQTRFDLDIESTTINKIDFANYIQYQIIYAYEMNPSTGEEVAYKDWVALNTSLTPDADYELLNVPTTTITIPGYTVTSAQTEEGKLTYVLSPAVGTGEEGAQITLACTTSTNAQLSNTDAKIYVKPYIYLLRTITLSTENAAIPLMGSTTYTLSPSPTNATGFKAEDYVLRAAAPAGYLATWKTAESTAYDNANQKLTVTGYYIGNYTLTLYKKDGEAYKDIDDKTVTASIKVGAQYVVNPGWDWVSYYYTNANMSTPAALRTSMQLSEVRSQVEACYWDPDYKSGQFFGSLTSIQPSTAYMVNSELTEAKEVNVFDGTNTLGTKALYKNYTWVGYPYQYDFDATQVLGTLGVTFSNGDKVIGKNASLEYQSGSWTGSLSKFEAGQSYIFYVQTGNGQTITWKSDKEMGQPTFTSSISAPARASDRQESPWQYDAHAFSNNMTIVAKVEADADCQIGAFVGDECRGEGKQVEFEGECYYFITVHGQPGETVSFKAFDGATYSDLSTTLSFTSLSGSLTQPTMLSGDLETNGIGHLTADADSEARCLDLTGRTASADAHGIFVIRQNGTTRKVVK